jgi:methylated-DNA-[protein]-cysteine S-methyltransferase
VRRAIDAMRSLIDEGHGSLEDVTLDLRDAPLFHRRVYAWTRRIEAGETSTYRALAERVGSARASRAVGQAMQKNPVPLIVPCHRVLTSDQRLGGFSAHGGIETKLRLLLRERDARLRSIGPARLAYDPERAIEHIRSRDPALATLIDRVGSFDLSLDPSPSVFVSLARSIAFQQLTGKAAETIWTRVCALFPFDEEGVSPARVLRTSEKNLRSAGLSSSKCAAFEDLAQKCLDGTVPSLDRLASLSDDEIVERITTVRGVGRWTAEMLLLFTLGRPDVLPLDDYGIKKGFQRVFGGALPSRHALAERARRWIPYRSVASWYLWRANDAHDEANQGRAL